MPPALTSFEIVDGSPFRGAAHTVAMIKRFALEAQANYRLRLLVEQVVGRLTPKDFLSEILAVYWWVVANVRYCNDPRTVELVRAPREVIARLDLVINRGLDPQARWRPSLDCDDMTTLLAAMLLALGREVQIVTVAFRDAFFRGERQFQHVFLRVREPRTNQWIVLDPVAAEQSATMLRRTVAAKIWPIA